MAFGTRELTVLSVVLAVPVASYFLVFKPQNDRIKKAEAEISHKRDLLSQLQEETARNDDLLRANEEIAVKIEEIEDRLPSGKEVDAVVRQVSDQAVNAGLISPGLSSEKPVTAASYMEQPLKLETEGEFHAFYDFLLQLEQMPRITRIPDMKLRGNDNDGTSMDIEFTLSIYYQDEDGGAS